MSHVRFRTLVLLEWRIMNATSVPWLVAALLIMSFVAALINGSLESRNWRRAFEAAQIEQQTTNFRAALPPLSTAILNTGQSDILPQRYIYRASAGERFSPFARTVGTRILSGLFPERPTENPSSLSLGRFDVAFVAIYIYPILILAMTYNIISADREAGVLALIVAQPISFRRWLMARMVVRGGFLLFFSVVVPTVIALLTSGDSLLRVAIWAVALLAYTAFWFGLGVPVSLRTHTASAGATIAIFLWLVIVILTPAFVNLSVPLFAPSTSTVSFVNAERAASLEINPRIDAANRALARQMKSRPTEPMELAEGSDLLTPLIEREPRWSRLMPGAQLSRALVEARRALFEQRLAPVLQDLDARERRLETAMTVAHFLSPALLFQVVTDDAAGTGRARHREFLSQLDEYLRRRNELFTAKILDGEKVHAGDFSRLPAFVFREEPTSAIFSRNGARLLALLAMDAVLLSVCFRPSLLNGREGDRSRLL